MPTALVLAPRTAAKEVAEHPSPQAHWPGCDIHEHGEITFAVLMKTIDPRVDADTAADSFKLLATAGNDGAWNGPWASSVPKSFIRMVGKLRDDQLAEVASKWVADEELYNLPVEDGIETLQELRTICRLALESDGVLLLWRSM